MIEEFRELVRRVSELERRMAGVIQDGVVSDADYGQGLYRVEIARDKRGEPVKTPWIAPVQEAGWRGAEDVPGTSVWTPYVVGQRVSVLSRDGDISEKSWFVPAGPRDLYPRISSDEKARVRKTGKLTVIERTDGLTASIGTARLELREDGIELSLGATKLRIGAEEVVTLGRTRLNDGRRPVHFQGGADSRGDRSVSGADGVLV